MSIPMGLKDLLGNHLSFVPTPKRVKCDAYAIAIKAFHRRVRLIYAFRNAQGDREINKKLYVPNRDYVIQDRHHAIENMIENTNVPTFSYKTPQDNLSLRSRLYIKFLREYKIFKVVATDKNMGPGVTTYQQYTRDIHNTLSDTTTYTQIVDTNIESIKTMVCRRIQQWHTTCYSKCNRLQRKSLKCVTHELTDRSLSYFYNLYKVHKPKLSTRPIVSSAGSIYYGISTWIDQQLRPYLPKVHTFIKDSSDFIDKVSDIHLEPNDKMFSLDVVSMYTNIQWEYAKPVMQHYLKDNPLCDSIISGLELIMTCNYYTYDQQIYLQILGTAMGNPLAPTYAILYLAYTEAQLFTRHPNQLICFLRFIDDIFIIWRSRREHDQKLPSAFLKKSKLDFTATEPSDIVIFLDMEVYKNADNKLSVREYQKPGNPHLYVPSSSAHPPGQLKSIVYSQIKRLRKINTLQSDFDKSVTKFTMQLWKRNYPIEKINEHVYNAINNLNVYPKTTLQGDSGNETSPVIPNTPTVTIEKIPFVIQYDPGGPSRSIIINQLRLRTLCETLTELMKNCTNIVYEPVIAYTVAPNLRSILRINKA